jgi:hypothetical protein
MCRNSQEWFNNQSISAKIALTHDAASVDPENISYLYPLSGTECSTLHTGDTAARSQFWMIGVRKNRAGRAVQGCATLHPDADLRGRGDWIG